MTFRCASGPVTRRRTTLPAVSADGAASHVSLPVVVSLAKELPAKLTLTPQLPELRGSSHSNFEYTLTIKNDSGKKLLVSLAAEAPQNFDTSFTEAYGSQQLTAIPVDAGKGARYTLCARACRQCTDNGRCAPAQPPTPSLGQMIATGRDYLYVDPWVAIIPGIGIALVVLGLNTLGDGLRDIFDPRTRAR